MNRLRTESGLPKRSGRSAQAAPVRATTEHGIDEAAVVVGVAAGLAGLAGEQGGEALEVLVGDGVAVHEARVEVEARAERAADWGVPASVNTSFVRKT